MTPDNNNQYEYSTKEWILDGLCVFGGGALFLFIYAYASMLDLQAAGM